MVTAGVLLSFSAYLPLCTFQPSIFTGQSTHSGSQRMTTCLNPMTAGTADGSLGFAKFAKHLLSLCYNCLCLSMTGGDWHAASVSPAVIGVKPSYKWLAIQSSLQSSGVLGIRSVQRKTFSRLVLPQAFFQMPASKMQVLLTPAIWCHCWNLAWNELQAHNFFTSTSPFPETREGWAQFNLEPCCYHDVSNNGQKTCWGQELCS